MRNLIYLLLLVTLCAAVPSCTTVDAPALPLTAHPDATNWEPLFGEELKGAKFPTGIWSMTEGVLSANQDQVIWTKQSYDNYVLDLEFKTAEGTNSGVIVYCSDRERWVPNSVEIQIADDFSPKWAKSDKSWQCAAIFGHQPATKSLVKRPGLWNHYTISCVDHLITVVLNGQVVNVFDMRRYTLAEKNPDGTHPPPWLKTPKAELETKGYIGLQGKHGKSPVYFRNLSIYELK
ncbi:MAG: DUF1080 domain-containing protein [Phycisphaerales bacterium]|jgi:hypothetical protein|nr:DUF1080 domain-containing protein [Phycisphaerales bacterium]MBT7171453.1 DUF1080 domain-containing protein [Phycisphaerales bacterium]